MNRNSKLTIFLMALSIFLFSTRPVHAYIDPGSGSILLQVILGMSAAAIGIFRHKVKNFFVHIFGKKKKEKEKEEAE